MIFERRHILGLLVTALVCSSLPMHVTAVQAQEKLVINDIAPWVKDDISIEPKLLTTKDIRTHADEPEKQSLVVNEENRIQSNGENQTAPDRDILAYSLSSLEKMYAARLASNHTSDAVLQFGYEMFNETRKTGSAEKNRIPSGTVQDNFILNIGDEINIVMRGQKDSRQTTTVTGEGLLLIETLPPIPAAGRSLGDVRAQVKSEAAKTYNTEVYLSLSKVAQVNVLVLGHVAHPGRQTLTAFDTVLDALLSAGGIEKTGTLRQIRVIRDGKTMLIDLYGLLVFGSDGLDLNLRDGDKIMVRPIGPTIAIAGDVKRSGIYEILPALKSGRGNPSEASQKLSMNDLLNMGGGITSPAAHRFLRMSLTSSGKENVSEVKETSARQFSDGDILNVLRGREMRAGTVELIGNANQSGTHSLAEAETLSALLYDQSVIGPDTYPLIGVIERWDERKMAKKLIAFAPVDILNGEDDQKLSDNDSVYLFSTRQIRNLQKADPQSELIDASIQPDSDADDKDTGKAPPIERGLKKFLIERSLFVRGGVRQPGAYPVAENATLEEVLAIAGGTSLEGDTQKIEVTSTRLGQGHQTGGRSGTQRQSFSLAEIDPHDIRLNAGSTIRINQKFSRVEDNHVLLIGEVKNPGTYDIQPGDTLGKLLARAGGVTIDAYPEGAMFSRQSERKREEARFKAKAQDLELKLATMLEQSVRDKDKQPSPEEISTTKQLITQLKSTEPLGRITIEADPGILQSQPQLDILLESGDRVYIPKRPLTVRVAGEVLSPAALQFRTEKNPRDYINQAGGLTYNADDDRAFVVYPDGSAQPLQVSSWAHSPVFIPPGSTIVVPRDPKPFDFIDSAKDISQILANVATAAIFADELGDDDDN